MTTLVCWLETHTGRLDSKTDVRSNAPGHLCERRYCPASVSGFSYRRVTIYRGQFAGEGAPRDGEAG